MLDTSSKLEGKNQVSEEEVTSPDIVMEEAQYVKRKWGGEDQGNAQEGEPREDSSGTTPGEKATRTKEMAVHKTSPPKGTSGQEGEGGFSLGAHVHTARASGRAYLKAWT